ncbi:MAG: zinc ribbon domain-containing protein, partial [Clostridia bacterium]|nr:zinc ribbon domain-containing protein [Clostridia bacterium]
MENEKKYLKNINYQLSQISQGINKLCKILEAQNGTKKEKLISKTQSNKKAQTPKEPVVEKAANPLEVDNLLNDFTMVPIEHEVEDVSDEHSEIKVFLDDLHNDNNVTDDIVVLSEDNEQHLDDTHEDVVEEIVVTEEIVEEDFVSNEFTEVINVEETTLNDNGIVDEHTEEVIEDISDIDEKQVVSVNKEEVVDVFQQHSTPEYDAEDINYTAPEYSVEDIIDIESESVIEDVVQNDETTSNIIDAEPSHVEASSVSHSLKFCPECGYKFEAGMPTKFCPECGYRLQNKS